KDAFIANDFATLDAIVSEARASGGVAFLRFLNETGAVLSESKDADTAADLVERRRRIVVADTDFGSVHLGIENVAIANAVSTTTIQAMSIAGISIALTALSAWVIGSYLTNQLRVAAVAFETQEGVIVADADDVVLRV
ncbi:hypothetical protein JZU48_02105, partial [bacterium]|nr:hypothetical protein [bacterium]